MTAAYRAVQHIMFCLRMLWDQQRGKRVALLKFDAARDFETALLAESIEGAGQLAGVPARPVCLLESRLHGLGLIADEIREEAPDILSELYRTCDHCPAVGRCSDDMQEGPVAAGWDSYCPNAGTLKSLV